jgi:hemoglobin/transferrin/lactoferrin receptor protein
MASDCASSPPPASRRFSIAEDARKSLRASGRSIVPASGDRVARPRVRIGDVEMNRLTRVALLGGASAAAAFAAVFASETRAESAYPATYVFDIPSKPLLAALADFTATTGVQVVRPGAQKLAGEAPAVKGRQDTESALRQLLAGSGLTWRATGPRTVTLAGVGDMEPVQLAGEATYLEQIDVIGQSGRRSDGGDGKIDVTAEDIERKQPQDVKQLFRGEPGVQVGGSLPLNQKVYVHGVEENNLAVSIDGAAQNNKIFHHNATTVIDPSLLKAARVDAGVAPADAGFGALAGSIAYETKDVADFLGEQEASPPSVSKDPAAPVEPKWFGGSAKTWFNTNGNVWGNSFSLYGRKNGFEALGFFNIARGGLYDNGDGDKVRGTATHLTSGLAKFAYEADGGDRFEFSHERVDDDAIRPYRANAQEIDTGRPGEPKLRRYHLQRQNSVFTYTDVTPTAMWDPKVVFAYSATRAMVPIFEDPDRENPNDRFVNTYDGVGKTNSLNGRAENKFTLPFGNLTVGADFRHDKAKLYDAYGDADERMTQAGVYTQARLEPIDGARLSFGGRGDYQSFRGTVDSDAAEKDHGGFSGNASGEYDLIKDRLTAKAGYSHVWAGIPLAENFIMNPGWTYEPVPGLGLGSLKAVQSDNFTAGLVAKYEGFTVEGSVFRTKIDNARIAAYSIRPDLTAGATRTRDLLSRGFELGAGYAWETGFAKVKWARVKVDIDGSPADSDTGTYLTTPVGDIITVTAAHTFPQWNVTVGADAEFAPKYKRVVPDADGNKYPYPAYQVVNAFLEYKPQLTRFETTLRVDMKNIFNKTYSSRASYGTEFGTNVTPLFEPGRSVILSAAVKF